MDWTILIDAAIGLITPLVWAISFRIAWPSLKDLWKNLPKKEIKDKKFLENNWRPKRTFSDPGEMELYNLKIENAIKEIDKEFDKNEKDKD